MAYLKNRVLFFTTSPRNPEKMIPEIRLLEENYVMNKWSKQTQIDFMDKLIDTNFYIGTKFPKDKAFSARDRINRAPKALGFVNLDPYIYLTEPGKEFISKNNVQEIFLRQLLKFQIPSIYHKEHISIKGSFCVRPYLELLRLIKDMGKLTFDELKIFGLRLINYKKYDEIVREIKKFRVAKEIHQGKYKHFVNAELERAIEDVYSEELAKGKYSVRESKSSTRKKFFATKKNNFRDYADACFRYLRFTGLVSVSYQGKSLSIFPDKLEEVEYILKNVPREPIFENDKTRYKEYLYNSKLPELYYDNKENLITSIMKLESINRSILINKTIDELKNEREKIIQDKKRGYIDTQVQDLKSFALYSEIIDTYNEIVSENVYDAPLMLEWNTWRAMTMLNGGEIKGNFLIDDFGHPMATAPGNMPDIVCDYGDFLISVEVTLTHGARQYESEGEPVARHLGRLKKNSGRNVYCIFLAKKVSKATAAHFYALQKINIDYYGGKSFIIPFDLDQFMLLVENSYTYQSRVTPRQLQGLLTEISHLTRTTKDENEWLTMIDSIIKKWPRLSDNC